MRRVRQVPWGSTLLQDHSPDHDTWTASDRRTVRRARAILGEKQQRWHAASTADRQFVGELGIVIAVKVADLKAGRLTSEVVEDWALLNAVPAPSSGHDHYAHVAAEAGENLKLVLRQNNVGMKVIPAPTLLDRRILVEKLRVIKPKRPEVIHSAQCESL